MSVRDVPDWMIAVVFETTVAARAIRRRGWQLARRHAPVLWRRLHGTGAASRSSTSCASRASARRTCARSPRTGRAADADTPRTRPPRLLRILDDQGPDDRRRALVFEPGLAFIDEIHF